MFFFAVCAGAPVVRPGLPPGSSPGHGFFSFEL